MHSFAQFCFCLTYIVNSGCTEFNRDNREEYAHTGFSLLHKYSTSTGERCKSEYHRIFQSQKHLPRPRLHLPSRVAPSTSQTCDAYNHSSDSQIDTQELQRKSAVRERHQAAVRLASNTVRDFIEFCSKKVSR